MKYQIRHINMPDIGSYILICCNTKNHIGIVEKIKNNNKMIVLLLDIIGKIEVNKNDHWMLLHSIDLSSLRYLYHMFINENINKLVKNKYLEFKKSI